MTRANMTTIVRRELVTYAVQKHMCCQLCKCILDARKAILITPTDGGCNLLCESCMTSEMITRAIQMGAEVDHWNWHRQIDANGGAA